DLRPGRGQGRLGESVVPVDADEGGADDIDVCLGGSVCPPALERIEVAGHPEDSVAEGAVTFAGGAVARQHARRCRGRTGGGELRFDRRYKFVEADALPCRRHSVTPLRAIAAHPTRLSQPLSFEHRCLTSKNQGGSSSPL